MTKDEKAETKKMLKEMRMYFSPPRRTVSFGEITEKFLELPNASQLVTEFEKKDWTREEFCSAQDCKKWIYDFLSDMTRMGRAKKRLDRSLAEIRKPQVTKAAPESTAERPLRREDFSEPTMLVVINKWNPNDSQAQSLYDATRGYWYVGASGKAYECQYVVASYFGRVMEVYEIDKAKSWQTWQQSPKKTNPDDKPESPMRRAFEGSVAPHEIRSKYIGRSTSGLVKPRAEKVYLGF